MMDVDPKQHAFVVLADELCAGPIAGMVQAANAALQTTGYVLTLRDCVMIGLGLKIHSSFRSLVDDARVGRSEAMHHLKTMVESFIYFHVVRRDPSDATANSILAELCYRKRLFYLRNPEYADPDDTLFWDTRLAQLEAQGIERIGRTSLEVLASQNSLELRKWYDVVYTAACEPAHITDLLEFMPAGNAAPIDLAGNPFAHIDAQVALDRGIEIVLQMAGIASRENVIGVTSEGLAEYEARCVAIRRMVAADRSPSSHEDDPQSDDPQKEGA